MLLALGLNHKTADISLREKAAYSSDQIPSSLEEMSKKGFSESLILSTCNRTEIYAHSQGPGLSTLLEFFSNDRTLDLEWTKQHTYTLKEREVAHHLFRVTSSLDSMVLGEPEILGQVKSAFKIATETGTVRKMLHELFQRSFHCAKRVRSQTELGILPTSIGSVASRLVQQIFGQSGLQRVLMVGAGDIAETTLKHLMSGQGSKQLMVCNRSTERGRRLAEQWGGEFWKLNELERCLAKADIVISSITLEEPLLRWTPIENVMRSRRGRPLFMIDLGLPRNIEAEVGSIEDVYLYNIDDLQKVSGTNKNHRESIRKDCEPIITEGVDDFEQWVEGLERNRMVGELKQKSQEWIEKELIDIQKRMKNLDEDQRKELDYLCQRLANRLLHQPIIHLKDRHWHERQEKNWDQFFFGSD